MEKNIKNAISTLRLFRETVSLLASDAGHDPSIVYEINLRYASFIQHHQEVIAENMQSEMAYYCNFYNVIPSDDVFDEFKNYYFLGMSIATELEKIGSKDLVKFQLLAILQLFNVRLKSVKALRSQLTDRISNAIEHGAIHKDFGRFGWYILYRCLFNAAYERIPLEVK